MTPGIVGAIAVGAALASDICVAGATFVAGSWLKDKLRKKQPLQQEFSVPKEFVAIKGG